MALARDILVWLPLRRLLDLEQLSHRLISRRLALLNRVSDEEFKVFASRVPQATLRHQYLRLCSYQGEVVAESRNYLFIRDILMRAAFLRDEKLCLSAVLEIAIHKDEPAIRRLLLQTILETDLPAVQLRFLEKYLPGDALTVIDPESITWTPALRAHFGKWLQVRQDANGDWTYRANEPGNAALLGYLQLMPLAEVGRMLQEFPRSQWRETFLWQIKAILRQEPQRNGAIPEVQKVLASRLPYGGKLATEIAMVGYVDSGPSNQDPVSDLFAGLRADELLRFGWPGMRIFVVDLHYQGVGRDTVRRARILLDLLQTGQIILAPHLQSFLPELQILAGAPVSGALSSEAERLAWTVGHPVVSAETPKHMQAISESNVKFDILHLAQFARGLSREELDSLILQLSAYGQLYRALLVSPEIRAGLGLGR